MQDLQSHLGSVFAIFVPHFLICKMGYCRDCLIFLSALHPFRQSNASSPPLIREILAGLSIQGLTFPSTGQPVRGPHPLDTLTGPWGGQVIQQRLVGVYFWLDDVREDLCDVTFSTHR